MFRRRPIAFALVDLVVTLVLIVTLSGLASLYYAEAQQERQKGVIANELDELTRAVTAWELQHKRPVTIADVEGAMVKRGTPFLDDRRYGNLDFLTEEGRLPETPRDPFGMDYMIDPAQGIVFSGGKERASAPRPGLTRPYRRESKDSTKGFEKDLTACRVPPVIAELSPCDTVLKNARPLIRGLYYASPGCAIDLTRTQLYLDGQVVENAVKSSGQVAFTPTAPLAENDHTIVLVVTDTGGNQARRQCSFIVHTAAPDVRLLTPASGAAVRCQFPITGILLDKGISHWVLNWDFRQIARGESEIGTVAPDGSITPGQIVPVFDTRDANQPVDDGRHFITLIEKDRSGLTFTAQSEVVVDNSPPAIVINSRHPGARGSGTEADPFVITTDIVRIGGVSRDNLMVRDVRYLLYDKFTGQEVPGQPTQGTTAVPIKWDPRDLTTSRNWGALYNAPNVDWSTLPSKGTTAEQRDAGFTPLKLLPGIYKMEVWAKDLAGNDSRLPVACGPTSTTSQVATFLSVNLFKGGVAGAIFLDRIGLARGTPYTLSDRIISGEIGPQTSGTVIFTPLEATRTPRTTQWEVVIDDNGGNLTNSGDNSFITTRGHPKEDWWATGELPTTTGEIRVHQRAKRLVGLPEGAIPSEAQAMYNPDSPADKARRALGVTRSNTATTLEAIVQGVYKARITYTNDLGEQRSTVTTFIVDKERPVDGGPIALRPVDEKVIEYREFSGGVTFFPCPDPHLQLQPDGKPRTITGFSQPTQRLGQLEFFGQARDFPAEGVIDRVSWSLQQSDTTTTLIKTIQPLTTVFPLAASQKPSNIVSYGYVSTPGVNPTMATQATSTPGAFDGRGYLVNLSVEDGAGLTTNVQRLFTFNSVGPLIRQFTIENGRNGPEQILPNTGDLPTVHVVDGSQLKISFGAVDETRIQSINYKMFAAGGGSGLPIRIPDNPLDEGVDNIVNFVIERDENNKEFQSLPTTYQLQVFGTNSFGQEGVIFATNIGFRFLTNVAVYAPHYALRGATAEATVRQLSNENSIWVGFDEQREIADFLFDNVKSAGVRKIFNFTGNPVRSTVINDPDTLRDWISTATSNGTTDVLVVLDAFPTGLPGSPTGVWRNNVDDPIVRFLESRSTDAGRATANPRDGDAVVWVGEIPLGWTFNELGVRVPAPAATNRTDGHQRAFRLPVGSGSVFYKLEDIRPQTVDQRYQETTPFGNGSLFLPSLAPYDPLVDFAPFVGSPRQFEIQLANVLATPETALLGSRWALSKLFTVDRPLLPSVPGNATAIEGANFVFRHLDSRGSFAHFFSVGPQISVQGNSFDIVPPGQTFATIDRVGIRRHVPNTGPVIREYIDRYLLNQLNPEQASRRVFFNALGNAAFNGLVGGARDVVYWPNKLESYTNVTTITAANQDTRLFAATAARGALYTSAKQPQFNPTFDFANRSLFFFDNATVSLQQRVALRDIVDASIGSNAGAVAFLTEVNPVDPAPAAPLVAPTVFYRKIGGADPATVTNGTSPTATPAQDPRVSANGDFVTFASSTIYDPSNFPPSFSNMRSTPSNRIYRYAANRTNADVYVDGEVSRTRLDDTVNGTFAKNTHPVITRDGRFVVWQARDAKFASAAATNAATQIVLGYNSSPGSADPWVVGPITADPAADAINPDMTPDAIDATFPYIVFESRVDYDNAFPHFVGGAPADVAINRLFEAKGATSTAIPKLLPFRAIHLFSGSFARPLLRIASSPDADCKNPRLSPDGEEVVFESRGQDVVGFFANNGTVIPQTIHNAAGGINRVYRIRIRPVESNDIAPLAIIQRVTPEGVDLGERAFPQLSN